MIARRRCGTRSTARRERSPTHGTTRKLFPTHLATFTLCQLVGELLGDGRNLEELHCFYSLPEVPAKISEVLFRFVLLCRWEQSRLGNRDLKQAILLTREPRIGRDKRLRELKRCVGGITSVSSLDDDRRSAHKREAIFYQLACICGETGKRRDIVRSTQHFVSAHSAMGEELVV